ncbi:MAG: SDR family NAD(P)-dependent oxidoreductase [Verrucomicrobiota bacterium]
MSDYNPFSLAGKRILITGASSGIGRACAIECSKLGANVILVARRRPELEITATLLEGTCHHIEPCDLAEGESLVRWMNDLATRIGPLDGLVHSAGITKTIPVRATSYDDLQRILAINVEAAFMLCKGFRQKSVRSHDGSIVLIGSVVSIVGQRGIAAYSASKGALVTMAKSIALEFASESIRVNVVAPGLVHTPMGDQAEVILPSESMQRLETNHPLGLGSPEDVAWSVAYLLSPAARWITGSTLVVDGGYTAA